MQHSAFILLHPFVKPKKVMYQTFNLVLEYLQRSNKIIVTKDGRILWVFADTEKLRRLLAESKKV